MISKRDRVRIEQTQRVGTFAAENTADLDVLKPVAKTNALALIESLNKPKTGTDPGGIVARLASFGTGRAVGASGYHGGTVTKTTLRDGIMLELKEWLDAAVGIASADHTPGILPGFRLPYGEGTESFSDSVRAICTHAESLEGKFLALGFEDDFIDDMRERVEAYAAADEEKSSSLGGQTGARGGLSATIREGIVVGRQLNTIFRNIYRQNQAKRDAWRTAYHTERVGRSGKNKNKGTGGAQAEGTNGEGNT